MFRNMTKAETTDCITYTENDHDKANIFDSNSTSYKTLKDQNKTRIYSRKRIMKLL